MRRHRHLLAVALFLIGAAASAQDAREELLARGTQLFVTRERALGVVAIESGTTAEQPLRARVSLSAAPYSLIAVLAPGERVSLGGASLEVAAIEPPRVRLRRRAAGREADPLRAAPAPVEGRLRLDELAIYTLPDGGALGVGNVRVEGGAPAVALTLFPPRYGQDPALGYDLHPAATSGSALEGRAGSITIHGLTPSTAGAPGVVEVSVSPRR